MSIRSMPRTGPGRALPAQPGAGVSVDADRLLGRISRFARIGHREGQGISRPGFGSADLEARSLLLREARRGGLLPSVDAGGNILLRRPAPPGAPAGPALLMGSHLDTVVSGGPLDGAYGVLAALEVLQTITESGAETAGEPVVVAFANEEGARFPQPFWGSKVLAGQLAGLPGEPCDHDGVPLRSPLAQAGGDLDALAGAAWPHGSIAAYLELHVEQGPVLERGGNRIGVVSAITGRTVLITEVRGAAGHAGTTPMEGRADAVAAASRIVLAVEGVAREQGLCRVATVGRMEVFPNSPNTIASAARLTIDLRDGEPAGLQRAETAVRAAITAAAEETGTEATIEVSTRSGSVRADPRLRAAITASAEELGLPYQVLPSGAGHDAQIVAGLAPIGMIFVPSLGGVSHVPEEATAPEDLVAGAQVLLRTALRL
jgi:beta-ureidopropionase / N-carbamoyl-L-amino-acid hydrolase